MRYVQRDSNGVLVGHFANEQPYATECVPDDHPDVLAWQAAREKARRRKRGWFQRVMRRLLGV